MSSGALLLRVLHEDDALLVVNKPAGLVCHPTKGDAWSSLISRLRLYAPATPVALVNRLDRETSGVTLVAKTRESAAELGALFASRAVRKEYLAIVHGWPEEEAWRVEAALGRDVGSEVVVKDAVRADGVPAVTEFRVERRFEREGSRFALVHASPETGRKHQIRIHLEHAGYPIVGDKIYGGDPGCYLRLVSGALTEADRRRLLLENQALHAVRLAFSWCGKDWAFAAPAEREFQEFVGTH